MSCQILHTQSYISGNENLDNSFANIDTAFNKSDQMMQFQNRIQAHNISSVPSGNYDETQVHKADNADSINNNLQSILNSKQGNIAAVDKMDSRIDEVIGSIYGQKTCQPIDRNATFNPNKYGSELLEGYNGDVQYMNSTIPESTENSMSIFKLVLLLLLIAALIYGGYQIYKNNKLSWT